MAAISIPLSSHPPEAHRLTDDFGQRFKRLLFSGNPVKKDERIGRLIPNMQKVAEEEKFQLTVAGTFYYARDHFLRISSREPNQFFVVTASQELKHIQDAIARSLSKQLYFKETAQANTSHPFFQGRNGVVAAGNAAAVSDYAIREKAPATSIPFYLEGGNIFTLTNGAGIKKVLIGQDLFSLIHADLRLRKYFTTDPERFGTHAVTEAKVEAKKKELTLAQVRETVEEMFALGLLDRGRGLIDPDRLSALRAGNHLSPKELAVASGLIRPFQLSEENVEKGRTLAAIFLVQREFIWSLLSANLLTPVEDIHLITQAAYHLDLFLAPAPQNAVFIQDYALCHQLLLSLKAKAKELHLTENDLAILEGYSSVAEQLNRELGPLLEKARKELKAAGFKVISAPGFFPDKGSEQGEKRHHVHFLNGISGRNKRPFFITMGAEVGDRLGKELMNLFEQFLKSHEPDLKVHFVGYDPEKKGDFSLAMRWWNGPREECARAGIHCLSFEE